MELSMERHSHAVCETLCACKAKQAINTDFVLPDYCGDIKRILHCSAQPQLHAVVPGSKQLASQGEIVIRLLYINEQDAPDCAEHAVALSVSCAVPELPADAVITARATVEYINCRALSARKVQLSGTVSVHFDVLQKQERAYVRSLGDCETRTAEIECTAVAALGEKTFDLSEVVAVDDTLQPIASVVFASAVPSVQSTQAVNDKVLVKGELQTEILYLSTSHVLQKLTHTLPISQVIDTPGATPECAMSVRTDLRAFYVQIKRDGNEETRLFDLAAKISMTVTAYQDETLSVIRDCYMTGGVLEPVFTQHSFFRRQPAQSQTLQLQQSVDSGLPNAVLQQAAVLETQTEAAYEEGAFQFTHHVTLAFLIDDQKDGLQYAERTVALSHSVPYVSDTGALSFEPDVSIALNQAALQENGTLQLRFDVTLNGSVTALQTEQVLTDAAAADAPAAVDAQLVLLFAKQGESLWQIAKRYRTTVALIREENDLSEETLQDDRMLLIYAE